MSNQDMWYNSTELCSKDRLFNYIIGIRGGGKTFHWKKRCIEKFLKNGEEFIWLRRYQTELLEMNAWADALIRQGYFKDVKFECTKKYIKVNGKIAGYVGSLSRSQHIKSIEYPRVKTIVLDEFLITKKGVLRYLDNEGEVCMDIAETVFRDRDKGCRFIFIGNAISTINPHFKFFNIKPNINQRFTLFENHVIELYTNSSYQEMKSKTRLGRIAMATDWGQYAYENKFINDKTSFICKREGKMSYFMTVKYNNTLYGVWNKFNSDHAILYIDKVIEENCDRIIAIDYDSLDEKCKFRKYGNFKSRCEIMKIMFNEGKMWYSDIQTKQDFYEVVKVL